MNRKIQLEEGREKIVGKNEQKNPTERRKREISRKKRAEKSN